ncbi:MAG: histidine decarboxylase [Crocinitomicaceae bacterium]|nr:histidine decarboxylase [Crocinitomicaceae bacterium]
MERLDALLKKVENKTGDFMGYPVAKDFDIEELLPFFKYPLNNLGDPFVDSTYAVNSNEIEREVIEQFADLFQAPKDNWWGYVTNGGSEGNLYSLYLAREKYPNGIVYFSNSTHYSIRKNLHVLGMQCITIRTQPNGEMDYKDLHQTIAQHRNVPVIVVANIGTTMTEAVDDVITIKSILNDLAIQQNYIHCDGALGAIINVFSGKNKIGFHLGIDSITLSGHKFIGSPIPCGIALVTKANRDRIAMSISYTGSLDTTITGSRNGHSPIILWHALHKLGDNGLKQRVDKCLITAQYAMETFAKNGIPCWKNEGAITIVIPPQPVEIQQKWQLATEEFMSHIICMPNISREQIDLLVKEITQDGSKNFPIKEKFPFL